jgi:hypothetical protein
MADHDDGHGGGGGGDGGVKPEPVKGEPIQVTVKMNQISTSFKARSLSLVHARSGGRSRVPPRACARAPLLLPVVSIIVHNKWLCFPDVHERVCVCVCCLLPSAVLVVCVRTQRACVRPRRCTPRPHIFAAGEGDYYAQEGCGCLRCQARSGLEAGEA